MFIVKRGKGFPRLLARIRYCFAWWRKSSLKGDNVMMIFCTLFNSGYLDKGLALLQSLREVTDDFRLYVVAFDNKCYQILSQYADKDLTVISMADFETPELLKAKENRTEQEYCWTCSCHTIKHVLETYGEKHCTYIDADMYFYSDPQILIDEIECSGCDVSIIEHGFIQNKENMRYINTSGKYCIEFNTFYATENGMKILNWWCDRCLEYCTAQADGVYFGDQKYLDDWLDRFEGVHVIQNQGAGVAPWNLARYSYVDKAGEGRSLMLRDKETKQEFPLIFYHYQQIRYCAENQVDIGLYMYPHNVTLRLRDALYQPYFQVVRKYRRILKEKNNFDLDANAKYTEKYSYWRLLKELVRFERDPLIALQRLWRIIFRKRKDIMEV